jgi:hypothetical protein
VVKPIYGITKIEERTYEGDNIEMILRGMVHQNVVVAPATDQFQDKPEKIYNLWKIGTYQNFQEVLVVCDTYPIIQQGWNKPLD